MPVPHLTPILEGPPAAEILVFIQGWPDDHRLWDEAVTALSARYRCVRFDLPGYGDTEGRRWGYSHDEVVRALAAAVREVAGESTVTLVLHDWGAVWGCAVHHRHPDLVARVACLDVAPHIAPTTREALFIVAYQWWLLGAFVVGGRVGDAMTRRFARTGGAPRHAEATALMNFPYLATWRDLLSGRGDALLGGYWPEVPVLFVYGRDKPARFHSDRWLDYVRGRPDGEVAELDGGHWVTEHPRFLPLLEAWLERTAPA